MKPKTITCLEIYESSHAVCAAAAQMTGHIEKLGNAGLLGDDEVQRRIAIIEEVRALTNLDVSSNMAGPELENATRAQQDKLAIERKWKDGGLPASGKMKKKRK